MSIKPFPKTIGMNIKLVIKKTHPDTTPIASGLKIKNKITFSSMTLIDNTVVQQPTTPTKV